MIRYVVLWIPTLVEKIPAIIAEPPPVELRDIPDMPSCFFRCTVDRANKNFKIHYRLGDTATEHVIDFTYVESNKSGFVTFELNDNGINNVLTGILRTSIHHSVYHYIKGLFHTHSFHDADCDSLLTGFCSTTLLKWRNNGVPKTIFTHYVNEYSDKLEEYYSTLSGELAFLRHKVNVERKFKVGVEKSRQLKQECFRIAGEAAYASSLLRLARSHISTKTYGRLYDIIERVGMLIAQCSDAYSTINNIYNNRLGVQGITIGALGIALTLALEITHSCSGSRTITERQDSLINKLILQHDAELIRLINRADSLAEQNERVLNLLRKEE